MVLLIIGRREVLSSLPRDSSNKYITYSLEKPDSRNTLSQEISKQYLNSVNADSIVHKIKDNSFSHLVIEYPAS